MVSSKIKREKKFFRQCLNPNNNPKCFGTIGYSTKWYWQIVKDTMILCNSCTKIGVKQSEDVVKHRAEKNKGKKRTEKFKKERSEKYIGKGNPMWGKRGKLSPHFGKKHTQEVKDAHSVATRKQHAEGKVSISNISISGIYTHPTKGSISFGSTSELIFITGYMKFENLVRLDRGEWFTAVPYQGVNGKQSTYKPDLFDTVKKIMYEIKGKSLTETEKLKATAGEKYCEERGWKYVLQILPKMDKNDLFELVKQGSVKLIQKKYKKQYQDWLVKQV